MTPVDLKDLISHTLKLIESDARAKGIKVISDLPADLPAVLMDGDRMSQVLLNLYLNAIQALEEKGTLQLQVTRDEALKKTVIRISDNGPGINAEDVDRIFDPYFTTKADGTGLGLAIVHKIMEAHGGDVVVNSTPNEGTTVILFIPDQEREKNHG